MIFDVSNICCRASFGVIDYTVNAQPIVTIYMYMYIPTIPPVVTTVRLLSIIPPFHKILNICFTTSFPGRICYILSIITLPTNFCKRQISVTFVKRRDAILRHRALTRSHYFIVFSRIYLFIT